MTDGSASSRFRVEPEAIEQLISRISECGRYGDLGVWRPVYKPEWVAAQDLVSRWFQTAGLSVTSDAVGNVWGKLEGGGGGSSVVTGSHIDSQTPGGRFDGTLGVVAGMLAVNLLKERFGSPKRTIEVVSFCEEEASRFPNANFWGSRAVTGQIHPDELVTVTDNEGRPIGEVMRSVGLDPGAVESAHRRDIDVFLELHIEQGPVLESLGLPIGIVDTITTIKRYLVEVTGRADHAGACPMNLRADAMTAAATMITSVDANAVEMGAPAVTTVGRIQVEPNLASTVAERVRFTVDARHPDPSSLTMLCDRHSAALLSAAERHHVQVRWALVAEAAGCACDPDLVTMLAGLAAEQGLEARVLSSGAGHDTQRMAQVARVAMIFVRSREGRSHTPAEYTSWTDAAQGVELLSRALYQLAY